MLRGMAAIAMLAIACGAYAEGLNADRLGVLYNADDPATESVARFYAERRGIPKSHIVGVRLGRAGVITPAAFGPIRKATLDLLPSEVDSLALVWSRPFAVGCMSVTTAFAAGYRAAFCEPGCAETSVNPLYDSQGWLPADTVGWWPSMLIPTDDAALAHDLIERGVAAQGGRPAGIVYLVRTDDAARNVRASTYPDVVSAFSRQVRIVELQTPVAANVADAITYFTGAARVAELKRIHFLPGALADHLTSTGGVAGGTQMSAIEWLQQGASASYGSVSEPCNRLEKFPNIGVLLRHYLGGETAMEAYWKSVAMPGQGLMVGDPLARAFASRGQALNP
jgi:uncharacterized protein (TIGR03790 family)